MNPNLTSPVIIESPGRINLIGEHIDYNGGYVMPAAIAHRIRFNFEANPAGLGTVYSETFDHRFEFDPQNIKRSSEQWQNYILGVVDQINSIRPGKITGFHCQMESNIPMGAGVSSSAALECGIAKGLNELFGLGLSDLQIIKLCRDAEHNFVGTNCGIMDQYAVVKGRKGEVLLLNCQTMTHQYIPADFGPYSLLLLNSNVEHNLSSSDYNLRREECENVLAIIQKSFPHYQHLAEVSIENLNSLRDKLDGVNYRRALYVVEEQSRTRQSAIALRNKDLDYFGKLLYDSHRGLKELFEVSCKEIDFLVDFAGSHKQVLGARMMGGGFGGCTLNLVRNDYLHEFIDLAAASFRRKFGVDLSAIEVEVSEGTRISQ